MNTLELPGNAEESPSGKYLTSRTYDLMMSGMNETIPVEGTDEKAAEQYLAELRATSGSKDLGVLMSYAIFGDLTEEES